MTDSETKIPDQSRGADWQAVEYYMREHDANIMKGYTDDIDALLTLDGLFSAVVTGFIVPAYAFLQEDTAQTSAELLRNISLQIQSFHSIPPLINSTFSPTPPSPFEAPAFARWVNGLWFVSLILSLASAVLGIIAKQWIREYLSWDISNAPHRENIVLRQARRESWDTWHAATFIAAIPALLEVAVVLFVVGLMIFTWQLDMKVGIVVIATAAFSLLLFVVLTALPTAYKRCPYKSPTAWAFLIAMTVLRKHVLRLIFTLGRYLIVLALKAVMTEKSYSSRMRDIVLAFRAMFLESLTWRVRDLEGSSVQKLPDRRGRMQEACLVVEQDLETMSPPWPELYRKNQPTPQQGLRELDDFEHLFRAFTWMLNATSEYSLVESIVHCVQSCILPNILEFDQRGMTPDNQLAMSSYLHGQTINAIWYLASRAYVQGSLDSCNQWPSLSNPALLQGPRDSKQTVATYLCRQLKSLSKPGEVRPPRPMTITYYYFDQDSEGSMGTTSSDPITLAIGVRDLDLTHRKLLGLFLSSQVKVLTVDVLDLIASNVGKLDHIEEPDNDPLVVQMGLVRDRLAQLLCALQYIIIGRWDVGSSQKVIGHPEFAYQEVLLDAWCTVYHHAQKYLFDMFFPGFRQSILDIILSRTMFTLSITHETRLKWVKVKQTEPVSIWVQLSKSYPIDDNTTREDLHIYTWIVQYAIEFMRKINQPGDQLDAECLYHMTAALRCATRNGWNDAGSYNSLFWIQAMVKSYEPGSNTSNPPPEVAVTLLNKHQRAFEIFAAAYNAAVAEKLIYEGDEDMDLLRLTVELPQTLELAQKLTWYEAKVQFGGVEEGLEL